jgi:hypothetical protein
MSETTTTNPTKPAVFTISAVYEGFPVAVQVEGKAESLQTMVTRLKQMGATPPTPAAITTPAETKAAEKKPPKCPVHGIPMKPSNKRGQSWFCPKKDGDQYCDESA